MPLILEPTLKNALISQFEHIVAENPDAIAVIYDNNTVSYREINEQVNQLAHFLIDKGLGCQKIGISGQSKYLMLVCQLAIMKANSTFIVFDNKDPEERVEFIAKNAGVSSLLHCDVISPGAGLVSAVQGQVFDRNFLESALKDYSSENPVLSTGEDSPAYLLYTSGSTGNQPKGVIQSQQNIVHQIYRYTRDLEINHDDRILQLATLSHDQAIVDIYAALLNGATLVLSNSQLDVESILETLKNHQISIFSSIPSMFEMIFRHASMGEFPALRIITIGGEETTLAHAQLFQQIASPHCKLINGYGATECSWVSSYTIGKDADLSQFNTFPLGKLTEGIDYILDSSDYDAGGELLIHGDGISPGYWNNEHESNKAFVVIGEKRYYRTGDIVLPDPHDGFHFLGRVKWHEKIRGQRVNTKEIEDIFLKGLPGTDCVVIAVGEGMNKKLVACVAGAPEEKESRLEKIKIFTENLSDYMIPSHVLDLAKMPYLANGKVDRQALKEHFFAINPAGMEPVVEKEGGKLWPFIESLWYKNLTLSSAMDDSVKEKTFSELGGNSLQAILLQREIQDYFASEYDVFVWIAVREILNHDFIYLKRCILERLDEKKYSGDNLVGGEAPEFFKDINAVFTEVNEPEFGVVSYVANDYFSLIVNYSAMCVLAKYYNQKYNIHMIPCRSYEHFTDEVVSAIRSNDVAFQIGLTWPKENEKDDHPVPCLLSVDENKQISLIVSDSLGQNESYASQIREHFASVTSSSPELGAIRIILDLHQRQTDSSSCSVDAIVYLKNTLQCPFLSRAIIDDSNIIRSNPPEALKTWQTELPASTHSEAAFFNKPKKNLATHGERYTRLISFFPSSKQGPKQDKIMPAKIYLYEKSKKMERILVDYKSSAMSASSSGSEPISPCNPGCRAL